MWMLMFLMGTGIMARAQENGGEERQKMQVERVRKQAERKADAMKLEGDKKSDFVATYLQYQNDLMNCYRKLMDKRQKPQNPEEEKKALTPEEAKARVDQFFEQQEMQVQAAQARLAVHKKYYAAFSKTLTPQQLAEVFQNERRPMQMGQGQRQGRRGDWGRRFEGGGDTPAIPR